MAPIIAVKFFLLIPKRIRKVEKILEHVLGSVSIKLTTITHVAKKTEGCATTPSAYWIEKPSIK